jgi:hypothetical protein
MTTEQRLLAALRAEHAAIFAYGPIGAKLEPPALADIAYDGEAAHRARRDALVNLLTDREVTPTPAEPVYTLPFAVPDRAAALRLALVVEQRVAATWLAALPETKNEDRQLALSALIDAATRTARVNRMMGNQPATVPFPGRGTG